jgi:hypothetical protein
VKPCFGQIPPLRQTSIYGATLTGGKLFVPVCVPEEESEDESAPKAHRSCICLLTAQVVSSSVLSLGFTPRDMFQLDLETFEWSKILLSVAVRLSLSPAMQFLSFTDFSMPLQLQSSSRARGAYVYS